MNGLPLLLVVAVLGVDVRWERTQDNQLIYAIQIEPELVDAMRDGQAVTGSIPPSVRDLRYFSIAVDSGSSATVRRDEKRTETDVDYGWRPIENGGVEYVIQIRPNRLETLRSGIPIHGEVDSRAGDIRRFHVFVGTGDLPRELPPRTGSSEDSLRPLDRNIDNNASAIDDESYPSRGGSRGRGSSGNSGGGLGTRDDFAANPGRRNSADYNDRGFNDRDSLLTPPPSNNRRAAPTGFDDYSTHYPPPTRSGGDRSSYGQDPGLPAQDYPVSNRNPPPARNEVPAQQTAWQNPPTATGLASNASSLLANPATTPEAVKPWAPLIMTTLGLFVSIAANTYLGWLAWTFFWRYREAVSELARSRSDLLGVRQTA